MNDKKGKLIVIVAPSGTGKSSLIVKLKKNFSQLNESVSFTTRAKRQKELDGVHYNFISRNEFESKILSSDFLEWALVHGEYKGTSKSFVESELNKGRHLLFDLDVQGADSMREIFKDDARIIFIRPPSLEELEKRLRDRKTDSEESIIMRLSNAKTELKRCHDYNYLVTNDDFDMAFSQLSIIVNEILGEE